MPKLSVPPNHPAASIIKELEIRFGNFEAFSKDELLALVVSIAHQCDRKSHWDIRMFSPPSEHLEYVIQLTDEIAKLDNDLAISLIPFLIERIHA